MTILNYIVIDLEFNQYYDFGDGAHAEDPLCQFEIIQLGAIKLDSSLNEIGRTNIIVAPHIYTRMHPFVQKITGITEESLSSGKPFEEAYADLVNFIGNDKHVFCVWGSVDVKLLYQNIMYYRLNHRQISSKYINVQQHASEFLKSPPNTSVSLASAVEKLGLSSELAFHDALNDAIYTSNIFRKLGSDKLPASEFSISKLRQSTSAKANSINSGLLFSFCEKELKHKLTDREKELVLKVYVAGQKRKFSSTGRLAD